LTTVPFSDPAAIVPNKMSTFNGYFGYRDSWHWDAHQYAVAGCTPAAGCNYTSARQTHFTHDGTTANFEGTSIEHRKEPLENRVWFNYPGQRQSIYSGSLMEPSAVGRVLDDGTTQLTQAAYNALGDPATFVDPAGRTTTFGYAPNQIDLTSITQKTGTTQTTVATMTYNAQHRPATVTDAAGETTTYTYYPSGQLASMTNPLGETTIFEYNPLGYLKDVIDANGKIAASFTRDAMGRVATYTDSEGLTLGYTYDAADRVKKIIYPDGTFEKLTYDKLDLASYTNREGHVWTYSHDADRRLISVTDPLGNTTSFGYYENGALKSVTDANGHMTSWDIDLQSRPTAKHFANGTSEIYTYEKTTSRLKSITDALGQIKEYQYNLDDRLGGISYANAINTTPNASFTWAVNWPRLSSMTDGTGTTQYSYVPPGNLGALHLQQETTPHGVIAYGYDALGRVESRTVGGVTETVDYDAIGRVALHTNALGQFKLSYLGETDQITKRKLVGSSIVTTWGYLDNTNDRRLASTTNNGLRQYQYTTSPDYLIQGITEETCYGGPCTPSRNWSMSYDNAEKLRNATITGVQSSYAYTPDPAGNITQFQPGNRNASYGKVNQLLNLAGQPYSSDANGSMASDGQRTYSWDAEKRLVGIDYVGQPGKHTTLSYDGLGRRSAITTTNGGSTTKTNYIWCGEKLCQTRNADNSLARSYFPEGEALAGVGANLYYGPDQIGSVRDAFVVTSLSTTAQAYDYEPYGTPTQAPIDARTPDFRFGGLFYHQDSGLYLATYRAYDPRAARWLSRDPIGEAGGLNLYTYVNGNPISYVDPKGEFAGRLGLALAVIGGVVNGAIDLAAYDPCETTAWKAFSKGFLAGLGGTLTGEVIFAFTRNASVAAAAAGGMTYNLDQFLNGKPLSLGRLVFSMAAGGIVGKGMEEIFPTNGRLPSYLLPRNFANLGKNSIAMLKQESLGDAMAGPGQAYLDFMDFAKKRKRVETSCPCPK
jgi:RHS repeat-associated protein